MAPVTQILLIANIAAFFAQSFAEATLIANFALWPFHVPAGTFEQDVRFAPWQLVTYSFLHGGFMHLAFNMLALFMFGSDIERLFGPRRFATFYLVCVISAALAQLAVA